MRETSGCEQALPLFQAAVRRTKIAGSVQPSRGGRGLLLPGAGTRAEAVGKFAGCGCCGIAAAIRDRLEHHGRTPRRWSVTAMSGCAWAIPWPAPWPTRRWLRIRFRQIRLTRWLPHGWLNCTACRWNRPERIPDEITLAVVFRWVRSRVRWRRPAQSGVSPASGLRPGMTSRRAATIDSLWNNAEKCRSGTANGAMPRSSSSARSWNSRRGIRGSPGRTTTWVRRGLPQGSQLEAAREFRKASDDTPNDPIAPEALLRVGDVYADLWRRPGAGSDLRPDGARHLPGAAQPVSRQQRRQAGPAPDQRAERAVRVQELQGGACTISVSRRTIRPSCT